MQQEQPQVDPIVRALHILREIERIMSAEGEDNWIHGIRTVIAQLEDAGSDLAAQRNAVKVSGGTYKTMMSVKDGFDGYIIWRDDLKLRIEVNTAFDILRSELWRLLVEESSE